MDILVIMGGETEREVSLMTGTRVSQSLNLLGHEVKKLDMKNFNLLSYNYKSIDLIFNALHGGMGENGMLQGFFDSIGMPYTGSGVMASALAMNKVFSKILFSKYGINVAKDKLVDIKNIIHNEPMRRPYVLKPIDGGSSIDIEVIDKHFEIKSLRIEKYSSNFFAEEYIQGRELSVAILGNEILGIIEIKFGEKFYNYNAKYKNSKTEYIFPKDISLYTKNKLEENALKAHKALACKGLTRADFIVPLKDPKNPVLLEINTLPGLTMHSLVPKIALNNGLPYEELISKIVSEALK